jgi:tripartite-type tricarboxylate transporter receptor subunit TctC
MLAVFAIAMAALAPGGHASAAVSAFPTKPITLIVPFPPGGRSDVTIRVLAPYFEKVLKQPVVIMNRSGGGGTIGFKSLAQAQPDGYTIGFTTNAVVLTQYTVVENLDIRAFEPICLFNSDPAVLAVAQSSAWKDVPSLVKAAKEKQGGLLIGINPGASAHIFAAAFARAAGMPATFVPYKGGPERVSALAGGHIDADFGVLAQYKSMVSANRVRVLGVASAVRLPSNKDVPTFNEAGVNLQISGWQGFFAPKGTPLDIVELYDDLVRKALMDKDILEKLERIEVQPTYLARRDFIKFLAKEDGEMRPLLRELGLVVASPK